jgi:NAD(P)H-hydrate epimerase
MSAQPPAIYLTSQVRELDRRAIEVFGVPGYELMPRAGHATLNALRGFWPGARSICVLCGPGNNGGDGYVVARVARAQGLRVNAVALAEPGSLSGDARRAFEDFAAAGGQVQAWSPQLLDVDVIVDAIFGTGLAREVSGLAAEVIGAANASGRAVTAVDIPSGLNSDSGRVQGSVLRAALTVSFIGRKIGCYLGEGPDCTGHLAFDGLGVPAGTYDGVPLAAELIDESVVSPSGPRSITLSSSTLPGLVCPRLFSFHWAVNRTPPGP